MDVPRLGGFIKTLREQKGYSQRELAWKAKVSNTLISNIEKGEPKEVSLRTLIALAGGLGVPIETLLQTAGVPLDNAAHVTVSAGHVRIPVLGSVPTDKPLITEEEAVEFIVFPVELSAEAEFALRVCGNSMAEAGIENGDYVFVRRAAKVASGDIVIYRLGQELSLKRYFESGDTILLQSADMRSNPIPVNPAEDFALVGVVVGSYRKFR